MPDREQMPEEFLYMGIHQLSAVITNPLNYIAVQQFLKQHLFFRPGQRQFQKPCTENGKQPGSRSVFISDFLLEPRFQGSG